MAVPRLPLWPAVTVVIFALARSRSAPLRPRRRLSRPAGGRSNSSRAAEGEQHARCHGGLTSIPARRLLSSGVPHPPKSRLGLETACAARAAERRGGESKGARGCLEKGDGPVKQPCFLSPATRTGRTLSSLAVGRRQRRPARCPRRAWPVPKRRSQAGGPAGARFPVSARVQGSEAASSEGEDDDRPHVTLA